MKAGTVLLTETMLAKTENPGPLPSRFQILQIRAESGTGRIWDRDTGPVKSETLFSITLEYIFMNI